MNPFRNTPDWVATDMAMKDAQFYEELAAKQAIARMQADASMYGSSMSAMSHAAAADAQAAAARYGADVGAESNQWQNASREKVANIEGQWRTQATSEAAKAALQKAMMIQKMILAGKAGTQRPYDLLQYMPPMVRESLVKQFLKGYKTPQEQLKAYTDNFITYTPGNENPNMDALRALIGE